MNKQENKGARVPSPKIVQRRGWRGFNNRPLPDRLPQITPAPPPPKYHVVPVEERKA